jgi:hypothetical protein
LLRRRGNTWHFQPVGPPGLVWIDGRPIDHHRPLPFGVPFRVGDDWLTLRSAVNATNDWGSFNAPIPVEAAGFTADEPIPFEPVESIAPELTSDPAGPDPSRARPSSTADDNEERLRRWQARLEQRERWLKDRQDERRWEARWKSAGESIRARSTSTPTTAPSAPRSTPPPAAPPRPNPRPTQTPPVARIIEPRPAEPLRRVAEPPRTEPPRVPVRPLAEVDSPSRNPVEAPRVRVVIKPSRRAISPPPATLSKLVVTPVPIPSTRSIVTLAPTPVDWSSARAVPVEEASPTPAVTAVEVPVQESESPGSSTGPIAEASATLAEVIEPDAARLVETVPCPVEDSGPIASEPLISSFESAIEDEPIPAEPEIVAHSTATSVIESSSWISELPATPAISTWDNEAIPSPVAPTSIPREVATPRWPEPANREALPGTGLSKATWPSAKAIFAAQGNRPHRVQEAARPARRKSVEPVPTDVLGPAQWSISLWIGWFPVLAFTLLFGSAGLALAYEWTIEANQANVAIKLALRPEGAPGSSIDVTAIPKGGWWLSNASHLSAWAVALERSGNGEDHSEDVRSLVNAARNASQLSARSRFLVESHEAPDEPGAAVDHSHLGRTRDVVTLASTGRWLRSVGKSASSLRAYRAAMEIASKAGRENLDPPGFDESPQFRRYALPRESLLRLVVLDMVAAGGWTTEQWTEALPPTATASLVAARVLADSQKRGEADRLADLAIRQAETNPPPGFDAAEHRAAGAEALAYRGRWTDSAEQYRLAIDQVDDDATRRMWWLNLAEIAQRVGDDSGRARAIEAAKAPDSVDEITRRAQRYQQGLPGLASSSPRR